MKTDTQQPARQPRSLHGLVSRALCWLVGHRMESTETHYGSTDGSIFGMYSEKRTVRHSQCMRCAQANVKVSDGGDK